MAIAYTSYSDVEPGSLGELFRRGARAIVVEGDPRIHMLWKRLLEDKHFGGQYPWEQPLMQLARNHHAGNTKAGDMARFIPWGIAHLARKIVFAPEEGRMRVFPRTFWNGEVEVEVQQELLWAIWEIAAALFHGVLPKGDNKRSYAMSLELLRYPDCSSDLDDMLNLLNDSSGGWTGVGRRLDTYKNLATTTLDFPAVRLRDWFAFGSIIPGVRHVLHRFNRLLDHCGNNTIPAGHRIIGGAHIDGSKVLSLLLSDRSVIRTEIRDGKQWVPLPLSKESITILPAKDISKYTSLQPTWHRVLMDIERQGTAREMNLTVAVCIVDQQQLPGIAGAHWLACGRPQHQGLAF
jgi:hypothetical protein